MLFLLLLRLLLPDALTWNNANTGLEKAKLENKPILMDVYTEWCGWCKVMDEKTYSDPRIVNYLNEHFVMAKLNPEKDSPVSFRGKTYQASEFAYGLGISGYPATAFFESDGKIITVVPGYIKAEDFLPMITYIAERKYYEVAYDEYLKQKRQ